MNRFDLVSAVPENHVTNVDKVTFPDRRRGRPGGAPAPFRSEFGAIARDIEMKFVTGGSRLLRLVLDGTRRTCNQKWNQSSLATSERIVSI